MRHKLLRYCIAAIVCFIYTTVVAQNADEIIYNQYKQNFNFIGGSFVIDTGQTQGQNQKKAFLIWAANIKPDTLSRRLALSEYGSTGNYLTERATPAHNKASARTLFPKKIIKSRFYHVYYVLAYVVNSSHLINGTTVYSTPIIYKIDGNTLNQIWATRISNATITKSNAKNVIEYNDMIETKDGNVVVVGKYAKSTSQKENVLATKVAAGTGAIAWQYYYNFGSTCNEGANAVAETSDGKLSIVGYAARCDSINTTGPYDMLYTQVTAAGMPVAGTYKRYIWQGKFNLWADNISSYYPSTGNDQLVVSGYVDVPAAATNASDRQILVANLKQDGTAISFHHVGDAKDDIARDLIFDPIANSSDYNLYLTGLTENYNSTASVFNEAYFLALRFNAATGVTALKEMSVYPVGLAPYNNYSGRTGIEIKNAGRYTRFAILATGNYILPKSTQTYTDVLIRDLSETQNACLKQYQPPIKPFNVQAITGTGKYTNPGLKKYDEDWVNFGPLTVRQLCQQVIINPYDALSTTTSRVASVSPTTELLITPNPVRNRLLLSRSDMEPLNGKGTQATVRIYNSTMQLVQSITIAQNVKTKAVAVEKLKPGLYMVQLSQPGTTITGKFLKE